MDEIKITVEKAIDMLQNIDRALDSLSVKGKQNFITILGISQDVNLIREFLMTKCKDGE